jgi:hypothetical protein
LIKILFLLFLTLSLQARENPFFAAEGEQDIPITSNTNKALPPLKRATLTLPSTARVIEGVTINYKTLDGAKHTKSITLQNAIDWHLPIFISQSYVQENAKTKKQYKVRKVQKKDTKFKKIVSLKFISLYENDKTLKILTQDKLLRDFILVEPHRIVCDFARDTDIGSYTKAAKKGSKFTQVNFGTHKGYYRVVIRLDGHYRYKIRKIKGGYSVTLM